MVDYGISVRNGTPKADVFLEATRSFATYYSLLGVAIVILTYVGTVLMNMSAYKQVRLHFIV